MGTLESENVRYQRTEDVRSDEAERAKRQQAAEKAAIRDPKVNKDDVPPPHPDKATG